MLGAQLYVIATEYLFATFYPEFILIKYLVSIYVSEIMLNKDNINSDLKEYKIYNSFMYFP